MIYNVQVSVVELVEAENATDAAQKVLQALERDNWNTIDVDAFESEPLSDEVAEDVRDRWL